MTDGTTDSNNTKFGSFIYGFTDDKIYYWTPNVNTSGCVLLLDGLWGSQNQQHCLSENDVALMIMINLPNLFGMIKLSYFFLSMLCISANLHFICATNHISFAQK